MKIKRDKEIHLEAERRTEREMASHTCKCFVCYMVSFMGNLRAVRREYGVTQEEVETKMDPPLPEIGLPRLT